MGSEPDKSKPLADRTAERLQQYIKEKNIKIGEKIPNEFALAAEFTVSRGTIREAVKELKLKGILEIRRGDGTYVISNYVKEEDPLGLGQVKDKYSLALDLVNVRIMLEPEIAELAAEQIEDEEISGLKKRCDDVEKRIITGQDYIKEDVEFHAYIAGCSKNKVTKQLIPIINNAVATFIDVTDKKLKDETIKTHRQIAETIASRDRIGAKCAMMMHLMYNREAIKKKLEMNDKW